MITFNRVNLRDIAIWIIFQTFQMSPAHCLAATGDEDCISHAIYVETDHPNSFGARWDSHDQEYEDINISLQTPFPIFYRAFVKLQHGCSNATLIPYFNLNIEEAFYVNTRFSSPVVSQQFNPTYAKVRWLLSGYTANDKDSFAASYIDFEYGHLSNGQYVTSARQFVALAQSLSNPAATGNLNPNYRAAQDYISRSWDYLGLAGHTVLDSQGRVIKNNESDRGRTYSLTGQLRFYGVWGPNRGQENQMHCLGVDASVNTCYDDHTAILGNRPNPYVNVEQLSGEGPRRFTKLNQVDGIVLSGSAYLDQFRSLAWINNFISVINVTYRTGIVYPLRANTIRVDTILLPLNTHTEFQGLNLDLWYENGFASDLVHYYEAVSSVGIALVFESSPPNTSYKGPRSSMYELH